MGLKQTGSGLPSWVAVVFLATASMVAAGCLDSDREPPPKPTSNWSVEEARKFESFPLYWLGESYHGLPLSYTAFLTYGSRAEFWYGEAKFPGGESDAWTPPLQIEIFPYCSYPPEKFVSYMESLKEHGIDSGEFSSIRVEDADGYLKRYSDSDESLYVWSGDNTIKLSTYSIELNTEEAARALTGLNALTANPLPASTTKSCPTEG